MARRGAEKNITLIARCARLMPTLPPFGYAIPLRLIVGYGFIEHGYAKIARGPDSFANILTALSGPFALDRAVLPQLRPRLARA
jgi:hypothetical protein